MTSHTRETIALALQNALDACHSRDYVEASGYTTGALCHVLQATSDNAAAQQLAVALLWLLPHNIEPLACGVPARLAFAAQALA